MLGNERGGGEESPLFLLRQWKKKERAILYAFQTPSTVSFRSSRDSSSAFSFHKLVRLDSDPMESSIHRGTISISPGSSQRSAFRFPPPSSSPHRWGGGGGLGSFKRSIEPPGSHRLLVSCLLACLPIFGIDSRLLVRSFVHGLVGDEFVWWLEGWGRDRNLQKLVCYSFCLFAPCGAKTLSRRIVGNSSAAYEAGIVEKVFAVFSFLFFTFSY